MSGAAELLDALAEGARCLEAGDACGAAAAVGRAAGTCRALEAAGAQLDAPSLERFRALQSRCEGLAEQGRAALQAALSSAGTGRRAQAAYRRR